MGRQRALGRVPRWLSAAAVGLVACALLMGPVLLFGTFTLRSSLADFNQRSDQDRARVAHLAADIVSRGMASRADQLRQLAARSDVQDAFARRDAAAVSAFLDQAIASRPDIMSASALDPSGVVFARVPAAPAAIGLNVSDGDFYGGALRTNDVYAGRAVRSRIDPNVVGVTLSIAVRQQGGSVRGIAMLSVVPAGLIADLLTALDVPGREIVLVDVQAGTIASTAARPTLALLELSPTVGTGTANVAGQSRAYVSDTVRGTAWTLYVLDDPAVIYAAQRALTNELGLPLVGAILAAGALAGVLAAAWLVLSRSRERLALANTQLVDLNDQVQAATRAKSDFLANMSHELRTPLNAVLGFSDVLAEQLTGTLTERQTRYLANIRSAGENLLELINDVLDLSKVEAGRLQLRPESVSLASLIDPVVASTAQFAQEKGVAFEGPTVPGVVVLVDPGRMRQVLLNLLSNAVKFTPASGSVRLGVEVDGHTLRFEVVDTGIGIPADKRDRVFGVFERLHEGRSDAAGTGLGLAITKKLVELQHGTIDFESSEAAGTRFWVTLEDVVIDAPVGPRVLIVEDDRADAELIAQLAREAGLRVEISPTAATALASIERSVPTAVVLDLRLPDRRGDDVLRELKSDPRTSRVPVFVVTVEDDDGHARLLGADDHMTKPIDRERLRRWLVRVGIGMRQLSA